MTAPASRAPRDQTSVVFDADDLAAGFAALAHPVRLRILELLAARGDQSVGALAAALGESVANTSHHLARLREAGLIRSRRNGTTVTSTLEEHTGRYASALLVLLGGAPDEPLSGSAVRRDG